jgi:3D (Asp-Asp-Asp) domain-containing protein
MNKHYNPERGVFIGKASKYLISGALLVVFLMPTSIKADTATPVLPVYNSPAINASSIISMMGIQNSHALLLSTMNFKIVWVTAYTSVPGETDASPFITADGEHVKDGVIAANWLPFGTEVEIPALFGDKIFTVEDRMNQAFNQRADIWMPTVADALHFGIQHVTIVVVSTPPQPASSI